MTPATSAPPTTSTGVSTTTTAPGVSGASFSKLFPSNLHLGHDLFVLAAVLLFLLIGASLGAVLLIWLRRAYHATHTRAFLADSAVHYELLPRGDRPTDPGTVYTAFSKAISDLSNSARARLSLHHWSDGKVVRTGITIAGLSRDRGRAARGIADQIARAVGAHANPLPVCPLPETSTLAYASRASFAGAGSLASAFVAEKFDVSALAASVSQELASIGTPAFVTVCAKVVSVRERNALRDWRNRYVARTASLTGGAQSPWNESTLLTRGMVVAGSEDLPTAERLCNIGPLLPDYESSLKAQPVHDGFPGGLLGGGITFLFAALGVVGHFLGKASLERGSAVLFALCMLATIVAAADTMKLAQRGMRRWLQVGMINVPARPIVSFRHGIHGGAQRAGNEDHVGRDTTSNEWHPYRLVRRLLVLTPGQLAVTACLPPASATTTGTTGARSVNAPSEVREAAGARLGYDPTWAGVQIPARNRTGGIMVAGDPGQGKSTLLLSIFASDLLARSQEYAQNRILRRAMIWFETKGEGAQRTLKVARQIGYDERSLCAINVASDTGWQLDLIDWNDPFTSAEAIAEAMRYAFPERSIMDDSEETLKLVLALALVTPDDVLLAAGCDPSQGYMRTAYLLLGGDPVNDARLRLVTAIERKLGMAAEPQGTPRRARSFEQARTEADPLEVVIPGANTPLGIAYRGYASKVRSRNADTEAVFAAPRNKVSKLLDAHSLWRMDPSRPRVNFRQILLERRAVVLNFGAADGKTFPDELRARLGAMSTYLLWQSVKACCDDWDAKGWSVAIYADELADVAGTGNEGATDVIRLMFDGGRSRGVWPTFATQRLAQLPEGTAGAALSSNTKVYLRQENYHMAEAAARDLVGNEEGSFTDTDIRRLPPMVGIARVHIGDTLPAAFSLHVVFDEHLTPRQLAAARFLPGATITDTELVA